MIINHNISALNTYNRLMLNNTGVSKSLEKLSSGMRINRAADDAAGLAISEKMRSQIRGLDQAQRNAQDGISLIQTAEGALSETQSILQRMRELSVQAANDTYTSTDRMNIQAEINQLTAEIDRIASSTQFNGKNLLDGSTAALVSTDKLTTKVFMRDGLRVLDQFGQKSAGGGNYRLDITTTPGAAQVQKTDIFKVKHQGVTLSCIDVNSGATCFTTTNAPQGTYHVETVDIATAGITRNSGVNIAIGCNACVASCNIQMQICATCAGSYFNEFCFVFTSCDAATGVCVSGNVITFNVCLTCTTTFTAVVATLNTCLSTIASGRLCTLVLSLCGAEGACTFATSVGSVTACNASMSAATTQGADLFGAKATIQGEFQKNKSAGSGLVHNICMELCLQRYNSSMVFEVTSIDASCNKITVNIKYDEYDKYGCLSAGNIQGVTLSTNEAVQGSDVTVGNVSFDAGGFRLADKDHFTVGDKFAVDVSSSASQFADKLTISDSNSIAKSFTFNNGVLNERQLCINTYYLDSSNGNVTEATFKTCFGTFAQTPSVCNIVVGSTGLLCGGSLSTNDVNPGMNYSLTVSAGGSCTDLQIEKIYSQSGKATVSAAGSTVTNYNASMLFSVEDIDGNAIKMRVQGYAIAEAAGGGICYFDTMICLTAGADNNISSLDPTVFNAAVCIALGAATDFRVGDKFTIFKTAGATATAGDASLDIASWKRDVSDSANPLGGAEISGTRLTRKLSVDTTMTCLINFSTFELDSITGTASQAKLIFDRNSTAIAPGTMTFQTTANDAVYMEKGLNIGDIARSSTKLYDVDKFWDANGNFILETPQTITMVQGDGQRASITLTGADTFASVREKMNSVIANGLGQGSIVGNENQDKFVSFVESPASSGLETLKGTFVIRSAISGPNGEINFVGNDSVIAALSLTTIQKSAVNTYSVDVTEAHTGCAVATNVKIADNNLVGVVHKNVDVQFSANAGLAVNWDEATKDFVMTGGAAYESSTFIHLADRTMVFQIGANQKQDVGAAIGNMSVYALGLENVQVTTNSLANAAISKIDAALDRVSNQRATLGALQNRLDHSIASLATTNENLTAAESRIRDVDMAKEMMNFTKFNILNQAATAMLAQANQLPQTVLQLLK